MSYSMNKILLFMFALFFNAFAATSRGISLPYEFSCDDNKLYNSLPEVELANKKLQESHSFELFLSEARELAQLHGLEELMGIRLIHHHFSIKDNEIMVEKHENFEGKEALVTRPQKKIYETTSAIPASWIFDGKQYHVFEYSNDTYVAEVFEKAKNATDFLYGFASLLKKYDYQNLIALAITDRTYYKKLGKHSFLERSYDDPTPASVVIDAEEFTDTNSINTGWSFKMDPITLYCALFTRCEMVREKHGKFTTHEYVV